MTPATATTVVRAVLQHGGGLVHTQQPRAHARGRQLTPRGGVIDRRCEATSIIPLPFPSSAAAVYPLTGVRRARTLSPSLRSNSRPHAQLVVGYGASGSPVIELRKARAVFTQLVQVTFESNESPLKPITMILGADLPHTNFKGANQSGKIEAKFASDDMAMCVQVIIQVSHCSMHDPFEEPHVLIHENRFFLKFIGALLLWNTALHRRDELTAKNISLGTLKELIRCLQSLPYEHVKSHCMSVVLLGHLERTHEKRLTLSVRSNSYCNNDAYDRTHCLNPRRHVWPSPSYFAPRDQNHSAHHSVCHKAHQRPVPPSVSKSDRSETCAHVPINHSKLPASMFHTSLQAPRHHVQRGDA